MQRAMTFGGMLLYLVATFICGLGILSVGYWISDMVYEADLWPIGAVMRVYLVAFLIFWIFGMVRLAIVGIGSLLTQDER